MTALPIFLLALAAFIAYLLVRSNEKLRKRENERGRVEVEEFVPAFQWPPRPKPAESHPRSHEAVVPQAGRKAA
jgi:hypothetical protein